MKIEYISEARMPTEKAHGLQIALMCETFTKLGHEVTLVVPKRLTTGDSEKVFSAYDISARFPIRYLFVPDIVTHFGKYGSWVSYLFALMYFKRLCFYFPHKDAIVYTRSAWIGWLFALRGFRTVCEIHDWPASHEKIFVRLLKRVTVIPCNSMGTLAECERAGLTQAMLAENGVDLEKFTQHFDKNEVQQLLKIPQGKKVILYAGALERWKGIYTLLEASKFLSSECLVVVIGGSIAEIEKLKKEYSNVLFLGRLPYHELARNQQIADVLVVPNDPESAESEKYTSPIKVFAHMASGIPIIASDLPSLRAILNESNAFFFRAGDVADLARVIQEVGSNTVEAEMHAEQACVDVQSHSWANRATLILASLK